MYSKNPYQGDMYKSVHSALIRILEKLQRYVQYRFVHIAVIWDLLKKVLYARRYVQKRT